MNLEIRALSEKHNFKIAIIDITELMQEILVLQETNSLAGLALSKVTIINALLALEVKNKTKINSTIRGDGPIGTMVSEYEDGNIRSYIENPKFDLDELDLTDRSALSAAVGNKGFLQVTKQNELQKEPYTSGVELLNGEISLDFIYYLRQSDQIYSIIICAVNFDDDNNLTKAAGLIVQLLPNYKEEDIDFLEEKLGSMDYTQKTLTKTTNYVALIKDIDPGAKILLEKELFFKCSCSRAKVLDTVKLLSHEDLQDAIKKAENIEVICDFCKKQYIVSIDEVKNFLN